MLFDDGVRGDLVEERTRRARESKLAAAIWYWRTSFAFACYVLAQTAVDAIRGGVSTGFGLRGLGGEVRHAARALAHAPWYSVTVIGVIALSMTFATATFAIGEAGATNAALFAVAMLAGDDADLAAALRSYRDERRRQAAATQLPPA